ncbi:transposase [Phaeobacter inhibens]|uniref:Transposase n=1 Tax=Phaeobacter inhibens TaxID=221822 RepID=A0A2I7KBD5_9RHOB|nr:transposase [Phaeobacter inhibens]
MLRMRLPGNGCSGAGCSRAAADKGDGACSSLRPPFSAVLASPVTQWVSQYLSIKYTERLGEAGIEPSAGSVGDSYEFKQIRAADQMIWGDHLKAQNALAETINGIFKAEVIHRRGPWRNFEDVEYATLEWVVWFNNRRLLEPIGHIPPAEAVANFYAALETEDIAAYLTEISLR